MSINEHIVGSSKSKKKQAEDSCCSLGIEEVPEGEVSAEEASAVPPDGEANGPAGYECCNASPEQAASDTLKTRIREKYEELSEQGGTCCGSGADDVAPTSSGAHMGESYDGLDGYAVDADLDLGCGLPTEAAALQLGETVLDLGSGAGLTAEEMRGHIEFI